MILPKWTPTRYVHGLILAPALLAVTARAHAENGAAIMQKVHRGYAGLRSYAQKASGTIVQRVGDRLSITGQTTELRFQQPNRLFIAIRSPQSGTIAAFSDGREMRIYRSSYNAYLKLPAPATPKAFLRPLAAFGIAALLDPLDFIAGNTADAYVNAYSFQGTARLNGASCYIVAATLKPSAAPKARSARVTFWVDRGLYLIRKVRTEYLGLPATVPKEQVVKGKRIVTRGPVQFDESATELIQEMQVNPGFGEGAFTYPIPRSAREEDPARVLGR